MRSVRLTTHPQHLKLFEERLIHHDDMRIKTSQMRETDPDKYNLDILVKKKVMPYYYYYFYKPHYTNRRQFKLVYI